MEMKYALLSLAQEGNKNQHPSFIARDHVIEEIKIYSARRKEKDEICF
jgi:hypothetical protein